jgi:excinuclease ABC subunit C
MIDIASLPHAPGCYLFSDRHDTIIYVGKAKDLKKRVTSYFQKTDHDPKTQNLIERIAAVDFVVTTTEAEALILENNLIKKHQPKYNIDLKDAKRFAYIEMTKEEFPRIGIARNTTGDAAYFGPFVSAAERDAVLHVVKRIFGLRSCRKMPKRACLRYHLQSCSAPCIGRISAEEYRMQVENAETLLKGKGTDLIHALKEEMARRSGEQEFEKALVLRNQISAIGRLSQHQQVEKVKTIDQDVIAYRRTGSTVYLMVFSFEKGRLVSKQEFTFEFGEDFFEEFLVQFYADRLPPAEVILPEPAGGAVVEYLAQKRKKSVTVTVPKAGDKRKQLDLVLTNIDHVFLKDSMKANDLMAALDLPAPPAVIECFDISHLSGTSMVGSMVQFRNGKPDKKNYRRFRIRTVEGINDVRSINEVVKRRYSRLIQESADLPDLIIIDGGKGQLSGALEALLAIGADVPVIAIAKREEEVYMQGTTLPLRLDRKGLALLYLQEIRNEAHRFAIAYHKLLRSKRSVQKERGRKATKKSRY